MDINKSSNDGYRQFTAFARIDGAIIGVMWVVSFFCFIGNLQMPMLGLAGMAIGIYSIILAAMRLRKFRDRILGGRISFGKATLYSIMTYFYATILMAVGQYVYFQFIDQGYMVNQTIAMLSMPETAKVVTEVYGMDPKQMIAILQATMGTIRPIEIAFQFLTLNVILGIIISVPVGALMRKQ